MGEVSKVEFRGSEEEQAGPDNPNAPEGTPKLAEKESPEETSSEESLAIKEETSERPEWLPEKFKSPEDMAKAYGELEKKLGSKEEVSAPPVEEGNWIDAFSEEFARDGQLSEDSYKQLAEKGLSRNFVDTYIQGIKYQTEGAKEKVFTIVGGEAEYRQLTNWAKTNLSEEEIRTFDQMISTGDVTTMVMAVKSLQASYHAVNGTPPRLLKATEVFTGTDVYEDRSQLMRDMASPEYRTSEAFRNKVKAKMARSNVI